MAATAYHRPGLTRKLLNSWDPSAGTSFVAVLPMATTKRMSTRASELQYAVIDEFRRITPRDLAEHDLWRDLLKTVRALANNAAESGGAQSRQDFIQKFHICLKESKECLQILAALMHACPGRAIELHKLWTACDEITAILVTSLKTAKSNQQNRSRS